MMTEHEFVEMVAGIMRPGECPYCAVAGDQPNPECSSHQNYQPDLANGDKYLYRRIDTLIAQARQILGRPNSEWEI